MSYFLKATELIGKDKEICFSFYTKVTDIIFPHYHDFFEFSLVTKGVSQVNVNSEHIELNEGSMILFRPNDVHSKKLNSQTQHINLAFLPKTLNSLFEYLGECFDNSLIMDTKTPLVVNLSKSDLHVVKTKFEKLYSHSLSSQELTKFELRVLLFDLITRYFTVSKTKESSSYPFWLENLIVEMNKKDNFLKGISAMKEISGKSHSHICSSFKNILKTTPTDFINDIRLNYTAGLLTYSDLSIIDISLDSGFENLSHFYHLFQRKYNVSPKQFREKIKKYSV